MDINQRLFVYGSLAPGRPNEHILAPLGGTWQRATVRGHLKQQGWGAAMGFPGLVLDAAGEEIPGLVFSSEHLASFWATLDDLEGEDYVRVQVDVALDGGGSVAAYVYVLNRI
jgi:gamma-glutamylcyclotransferase (GGCT)/AIG2-like uncharacterized protein YtfP